MKFNLIRLTLISLVIFLFGGCSFGQVPIFKISDSEFLKMTKEEHLLCDTLYSYYHQFEYDKLNRAQKLFFVIPDVCMTIWTNGLLVTLTDDYTGFVTRAEFAYSEVKASDILQVIVEIREFYEVNLEGFKSGDIVKTLDPDSELYEETLANEFDILEAKMIDMNCWAWMNLSEAVFDYIKQHKNELVEVK